jgi:chemotaxis protein CheX
MKGEDMDSDRETLKADLGRIMDMVWSSTLGEPLAPMTISKRPPPPLYTACLQVAGAYEGTMLLEIPVHIGRSIAGQMFGMEPAAVSDAEVRDAVGELVNMIGGNVKALLPGPSFISLPAVAEGSDYLFSLPGTVLAAAENYECKGACIRFALFESARCAAGRRGN